MGETWSMIPPESKLLSISETETRVTHSRIQWWLAQERHFHSKMKKLESKEVWWVLSKRNLAKQITLACKAQEYSSLVGHLALQVTTMVLGSGRAPLVLGVGPAPSSLCSSCLVAKTEEGFGLWIEEEAARPPGRKVGMAALVITEDKGFFL